MIQTDRLVLRGWGDNDLAPFAAMCRDRHVMAFIGPLQSRSETSAAIDRQRAFLTQTGHCFWAVERRSDGALIGFCGLKPGAQGTPIAGEIEIGWRLAHAAWGMGYAREAAEASLDWGWRNLSVHSIAAITVPANQRSWRLMERIGMKRAQDEDFDHPAVPPGSDLRRHMVYRATRPASYSRN
jgi:RimJ/RimL family protein N-acetyltransferase